MVCSGVFRSIKGDAGVGGTSLVSLWNCRRSWPLTSREDLVEGCAVGSGGRWLQV